MTVAYARWNHRILMVLAVSLGLAACQHKAQYHVDRGDQFLKEKRYTEATLEYRTAVQKDNTAVQAYYGLAQIELAQGQTQSAVLNLGIALRVRPDFEPALVSLADIRVRQLLSSPVLSQEAYDDVEHSAEVLLSKDPQSYDGLRLRGHLNVVDGHYDVAEDLFGRAEKVRPGQPDVQLALANAKARNGQLAEAEQMAQALIEKHPDFGPAYDFLQLQYSLQKRLEAVDWILKQKADNNPKIADYQLQLASQYLLESKPDDADKIVKRLLADTETFPDARLRVGDFYLRLGNQAGAQKLFEEGVQKDSARLADYKKRLISLAWGAQRRQEAIQLANDLVKAAPTDAEALHLRASMLLEEGKPENLDQVIADYTKLRTSNPRNPLYPYQIGRVYLLKGNPNQAVALFSEALTVSKNYIPARVGLAELRIAEGQAEKALSQLNDILVTDPGNAKALLLRASALRSLKRFDEASNQLKELAKAAPASTEVQVERGRLYAEQRNFPEAEAIFEGLYRSEGGLRSAIWLAEIYAAEHKSDKAIQLIEEQVKKDPKSGAARQALATIAQQTGNPQLALAQLKSMAETDPKNAAVYVRMGLIEKGQGNVDAGLDALRKASDLAPKDTKVLLALSATLQELGKSDEAKNILERVLKLEEDNPVALNNLAYLLSEDGKDLDQALQMAMRATQKEPSSQHFKDTLGTVYLRKGMSENALPIFESLTSADPKNPIYHKHLGMALLQKGERVKARNQFQAALLANNSPKEQQQLRELLTSTSEAR